MKYEKPSIMDLGERTRHVDGAEINVCYTGGTANTPYHDCATGNVVNTLENCITGGNPGFAGPGGNCLGGTAVDAANWDCYSGGVAYACNQGAQAATQDYGCTVGPSFVG